MEFEYLHTERLRLRKWTPESYERLFKDLSEEDQIHLLGMDNLDQLREDRSKYDQGFSTFNKKFVNFQLIPKGSERVIGWCAFHTWYIDHRRAEIGYWLLKDAFKKKGYVSEAMRAVLKYGFSDMNLNRMEAFVSPENEPSLKIMEKFGFSREGYLRQHYAHNGKIDDSVLFGLLKEDYLKQV
jgi:ribosomal-protein-alanine N-acetyltransferase